MSSYSAADAHSDVKVILRDFQRDFMLDCWLDVPGFQASLLGSPHTSTTSTSSSSSTATSTSTSASSSCNSNNSSSVEVSKACRVVSEYNDQLKYLKFVTAALDCSTESISASIASATNKATGQDSASYETTAADHSLLDQTEFLAKLPFSVTVADIVKNNSVLRDICAGEITGKQLQKDIERDQLVIDGMRVAGSSEGLDYCLTSVGKSIDNCLSSCFLPALGSDLRMKFARAILTTACRTNSGGVALHTLRSITDTEKVMLFPNSTEAGSLLVKISVGKFRRLPDGTVYVLNDISEHTNLSSGNIYWGLRGEVQASIVYDVASMADAMEPDLDTSVSSASTVKVIYENCVCLEVDSRVDVMEEGVILGGNGTTPSGKVSFHPFLTT